MSKRLNIAVLNGSPKGNMSITMQYIEFIRKKYKQHALKQFNVARQIKNLEQDENYFNKVIKEIAEADGIIWGFPLYYFLVPSQYKKFIELIFERNKKEAFNGKYAASLSTSVHFYDHAAHNYINAVCNDLGMNYVDKFSADMYDLIEKKWQNSIVIFADDFFKAIEQKRAIQPLYALVDNKSFAYIPRNNMRIISVGNKKVTVVTDTVDQRTNLGKMVNQLEKCLSEKIEVIDLNTLNLKDGCIGCLQCGYDNSCIYEDKDMFNEFFEQKIKTADVLIYAATIKDRFLSSTWKLFFDRCFFLGHIPSLSNKQIGFMISGPLSKIHNLQEILEAYVECVGANIAGFIADERENSDILDSTLQDFAERIIRLSEMHYKKPYTFLSIGGRKVLRDDVVWGRLRFIFQADHRYYIKHKLYDFPQRNIAIRLRNIVMMHLTKIPSFRKKFMKKIRKTMIMPHKKILRKTK